MPPIQGPIGWCNASWVNGLIQKHAWLSTGLTWTPTASGSGQKVALVEHCDGRDGEEALKPDSEESAISCLDVLEFWEDGGRLTRDVGANALHFPKSFATGNPWNCRTYAFSWTMPGTSTPEL